MKKFFLVLLLACSLLAVKIYGDTPDLNQCISNIGKLQVLIEYFYMEFGEYPPSVKSMEEVYNEEKYVKGQTKIVIPKDPSTGKDFIYEVSPDGQDYSIKVPLPEKYGLKEIKLQKVDWGWMMQLAGAERRQALIEVCIAQMKKLATDIEIYASDNKNKYPEDLKILVPKYEKSIFKCPACNKEYTYKKIDSGYEIFCYDPSKHRLKVLKYDSNKGIIGQ